MTRITTILIGLLVLVSCCCYQRVSGTDVSKEIGRFLIKLDKQKVLSYKDTNCIPKPDTLDQQQVYLYAEKNAEFPGGQDAFMSYLQKNLCYPKEQEEWEGSIYITFVVDTLGNIRNECILKRYFIGELTPIEKEALKLIREMPNWTAAKNGNKKVYMRINLPIKF